MAYDPPGIDFTGVTTGRQYRVADFHSDGPWLFRKHPDGQWVSYRKMDLDGIRGLVDAVSSGAWLVSEE